MDVRADTYLWAIRMYKSRSLASDAIKGGKAKVNGDNFKPSHLVKAGEVYTLSIGQTKKIVEVVSLIERRASFEIASQHYKDRSPPPEKTDKLPSAFFKNNVQRERGSGRPSKKDRRDIDDLNYF